MHRVVLRERTVSNKHIARGAVLFEGQHSLKSAIVAVLVVWRCAVLRERDGELHAQPPSAGCLASALYGLC